MKVPFLDLKAQYDTIREEVTAAIQQVIDRTAFAGGPFVAKFEEEFAAFCGTRHAVAVGNGTDALWLALAGLGIGEGDEVITVPNTFIATTEAISHRGAIPVFVDVDPRTWLMDPAKIEAAITPRTKAILPVHLFGQMCDMDPILEIARKHGLYVVEDACQAHGAEYKGRAAGSIGHAGCFSFYPGKNLGAYGEAGGLVTNDDAVATKARMLRDHGQEKKYFHKLIGWNMRMDGIQGAVLSVKLKHIRQWNEARRSRAKLYGELLSGIPGVAAPFEAEYGKPVYHIYAVCVKDRDAVIAKLAEKDIHCGIHYPVPLHLQEAYAFLGKEKGSFPVAEKGASGFVSLPMYPELSDAQVRHAVNELKGILGEVDP